MPGDDPVPVFFDGLDKKLQRLQSRTLCAEAPVAEKRLGSLLWLGRTWAGPGRGMDWTRWRKAFSTKVHVATRTGAVLVQWPGLDGLVVEPLKG